MVDVTKELTFKTARSGGSGGQNVNKVETMVEGYWNVNASILFTTVQKARITEKLANKINSSGLLQVKNQTERSQLGNKHLVIKKINTLIARALVTPVKRKKTGPSAAAKQSRLTSKKRKSDTKAERRSVRFDV